MPSPVFIVCSEGGSIDRHTNQLSIFDVIERLTFARANPTNPAADGNPTIAALGGARPMVFHSMRMAACWRREEGEEAAEFEYKTTLEMPGAEPLVVAEGVISFKSEWHRFVSTMHTDMPTQSGQMVITNSLRPAGNGTWISQRYVIPVEKVERSANLD
jgi:hypothetical protein